MKGRQYSAHSIEDAGVSITETEYSTLIMTSFDASIRDELDSAVAQG
jgi:hypothetical protein